MGPLLVIKRGEYGLQMFQNNNIFSLPAFPLEEVFDPTGAGGRGHVRRGPAGDGEGDDPAPGPSPVVDLDPVDGGEAGPQALGQRADPGGHGVHAEPAGVVERGTEAQPDGHRRLEHHESPGPVLEPVVVVAVPGGRPTVEADGHEAVDESGPDVDQPRAPWPPQPLASRGRQHVAGSIVAHA